MSNTPSAADTPLESVPPSKLKWQKFRRWAVRRLIVLFVLLTLYVLSIGPMWWSWYSGMYVSTEVNYWVIAFYEPLHQACRISWINGIVSAYIEWWNL